MDVQGPDPGPGASVEALYDRAPCGLLVTDDEGLVLRVNATFCDWLGVEPSALVGKRRFQDLLTMGGRIFHQTQWTPLLHMQGSVAEVKLDVTREAGAPLPMVMNAIRRTCEGVTVHELALWMANDRHAYERELLAARKLAEHLLSEQRAAHDALEDLVERLRLEKLRADQAVVELEDVNRKLLTLATTDSLTGAANHRLFVERTAAEVARSRRKSEPLALLALDLDHFKAVNDRYGHPVGDDVLKSLVSVVTRALRPSDLVARTGGEEFKVLLPDTTLADAVAVAERIRLHVEAMAVSTDKGLVSVTVSIGCAALEGDLDSTEQVADQRLYQAKALGRNRVVAAESA